MLHRANNAESVHKWITRHLSGRPHPAFVRPVNYVKVAVVITAILGAITFVTVASPYILPILQNRNLWAAISLIAVLLFTSGHMYNHIRKVPYVQPDGKGGVSYFAGGFQNQFGLETQIVAAMCKFGHAIHLIPSMLISNILDGVLSFATISLALKVPRITDPRAQAVAVAVWGGVILFMYSFLLSIFRIKNGGYPFWLPPF